MQKFRFYASVAAATLFTCILMLFASCFLPQSRILNNALTSISILNEETVYPMVVDQQWGSALDNFTDSLIIMESIATDEKHPQSMLLNPIYFSSSEWTFETFDTLPETVTQIMSGNMEGLGMMPYMWMVTISITRTTLQHAAVKCWRAA